ncbi:MAG: type II toxin-antitoxin system PemK/MazF family toxin [Proteobacteria bacterium]|nr:type II toxin-antitoxin system PemK/MazF family toxin [Pseudomonadota bacterium]
MKMKSDEPAEVRRGDILWINCDPSVGAEPRKTRTCLVVSNDLANRFGQAVTVIPTQRYSAERARRAYMVDLRGPRSDLPSARVANASMIMTYDRSRIAARAGRVSRETLRAVDSALALHLGIEAAREAG